MLQGVDLNQVRQYNASLKQYRDKAANINAQIEFTQKDLANLCKELTAELGVEVTENNVEQIYNEQVEKINATLKSGNTVLAKIAEEEQRIASGITSTNTQQTPPQMAQPQQAQQMVQPDVAQPSGAQSIVPPTPPSGFESNAVAGSVFGNGSLVGGQNLFELGLGNNR